MESETEKGKEAPSVTQEERDIKEERDNIKAQSHASLIAEALEMLATKDLDSIAHLKDGLRRYLTDRIETGGFLRRVLENDLSRAVGHANPSLSMAQMKTLVQYLNSSFPAIAWGSPEKVAAWLAKGQE